MVSAAVCSGVVVLLFVCACVRVCVWGVGAGSFYTGLGILTYCIIAGSWFTGGQ